jgi:hypothetical protein
VTESKDPCTANPFRTINRISTRSLFRRMLEGVASVTGAHYEGGHWLGSFAVYLVTSRGISM